MIPRIGFGYDVHILSEGYDFWLGGMKIEHYKGCIAHSDGDTLIHALCDALLGAAALGDIGVHFPDTSDKYKRIDSKILLSHVVALLRKENYTIGNADVTVCLQQPKIKDHIPEMQKILSDIMNIPANNISIKATTTEKLGFVGHEEGIAVYAVALIIAGKIEN
ncbi:MAG: 2-C-methyl-D-erythritol 2,4-cyclodiphosphate synthase [Prevotellaceae bacterium]|jgi:2-C-methyl-D-erythritol 2,4-cyclodiphosphate synthase|nr:2-C-methyl-D-erythritol 2,4-cyclodiphosphate synthase [Prevotellaceae bacterium]